jgi:hypothetical protein
LEDITIKNEQMKKIFTLALTGVFALATSLVSAQSTRMAFVEEATQASCGPCASLNPALQTLMNANTENTIFMAYQVWWPGFDQMYLDNSVEVNERVGDYYGYTFAPQAILQGSLVGGDGGLGGFTQTMLDDINADTSEFDLTLSAEIVNGQLQVSGSVEATMAADGDFKLRIMIVEEAITSTDAPGGTNGETEYHHVFKGFVGGSAGIDLENAWVDGDTYTIDETFDIGSLTIYHYDGLEVIAIVQNDDNKFVNQAIKDSEVDIVSDYDNSAAAVEISGLPYSVCVGEQTISPTFKLINHGITELTSATLTYNINGGADQSMDWTGSLSTLANMDVVLDPYTFTTTDVNTITVTVSMPNGVADENSDDNNTVTVDLVVAPYAGVQVEVEILTDNYGAETYWEIRNSAGDVVESGGNPNVGTDNIGTGTFPAPADPAMYGNNEQVSEIVNLPANDCYTFHVTDYYGDGILGDGYYRVNDENGVLIIAEDNLTDEEVHDFNGDQVSSVEDLSISNFNIYPNPTNDVAHISFNLVDSKNVRVEVLDLAGRVVYQEEMGQLNSGSQLIDINASQIGNGMYIFNIYAGTEKISERVSISK